jgi:hypothetical protein
MPDPITPETPDETPAEEVELGDAGKKAIAAERKRADALDKELKALRLEAETRANAELSELERFKKENAELQKQQETASLEALRLRVALEKGLPANLAARLQGSDYDELAADADSLSELIPGKPNGLVRVDPSQGPKPAGAASPADQFAASLKEALQKH